jgi:hypothetical protein
VGELYWPIASLSNAGASPEVVVALSRGRRLVAWMGGRNWHPDHLIWGAYAALVAGVLQVAKGGGTCSQEAQQLLREVSLYSGCEGSMPALWSSESSTPSSAKQLTLASTTHLVYLANQLTMWSNVPAVQTSRALRHPVPGHKLHAPVLPGAWLPVQHMNMYVLVLLAFMEAVAYRDSRAPALEGLAMALEVVCRTARTYVAGVMTRRLYSVLAPHDCGL